MYVNRIVPRFFYWCTNSNSYNNPWIGYLGDGLWMHLMLLPLSRNGQRKFHCAQGPCVGASEEHSTRPWHHALCQHDVIGWHFTQNLLKTRQTRFTLNIVATGIALQNYLFFFLIFNKISLTKKRKISDLVEACFSILVHWEQHISNFPDFSSKCHRIFPDSETKLANFFPDLESSFFFLTTS